YKLLDFGEGVINGIFSRLGSARTFRVVGFLALLALFTFAGLVELWCWLTLGGEFLGIANNSCMHLFSRSYIQHATELSFSLTGFLFVGVSVVAVITRQSSDEPTQTAELTIVTGEEIPEVEGTYSLYRDEIERYVGGSRIDSTLIGWSVVSNSPESLIAYREQKLPVEPPDGTYEIWNSITGPTPTEGDAWRLHETTDQQRDDEPLPDWLQGPNGEIDWWIVPDTEPQLEAFKLKLKRAVGYAVSASILGVIIQSYPWNLSTDPDPWLETLPMHQHLLYGILATIFTFVFIGMAWTSIGLLELIQKSRSAD
ncbi:hypothetical protein, partial [Halorubrum sp. BV1]|uniref:hypothetical protein n=1 Tax=Halorubrum sp. BV1 TaxID=1498500 RepID=UPI001E488099